MMQNLLKLLTAIILGLVLGTFTSYSYYSKSYRPFKWASEPIVANCYGKDISRSKIESAVSFWNEYGDSVALILMDPPKSVCKHDLLDGFIILKKAKRNQLDGGTLAKTKTKIQYLRLRAAVIYFGPGTYNVEWLTEHEFGHAFGYKHVEELGNIMHPFIEHQGGKWWIPD